jgi:ABC-type transport system involved in multi-copper enzyme maturation permease subunit
MSSHPPSPAPAPRGRRLLGSDTVRPVLEAGLAVALAGAAAALLWYHAALAAAWPALPFALWGLWLAAAVLLRRAGFFTLFGPVLYYDMVRAGRRARHVVMRTFYALLLLFLVSWTYWVMSTGYEVRGGMRPQDLRDFASTTFNTFVVAQFLILCVLTPAYTAGAVAEEKDRRTLEFILATDLRSREIVAGKLASRLANLGMYLLAGLPILSALQFLGGISPVLVLAAFAATAMTVVSLGALGIFQSVRSRKASEAIILTYLTAFAFLVLTAAARVLLIFPDVADWPSTDTWTSPVQVKDVIDWVGACNPFVAVYLLLERSAGPGSASLESLVPGVLLGYCLFHAALAAFLVLLATLCLRSAALRETAVVPKRAAVRRPAAPTAGAGPQPPKVTAAEPRPLFPRPPVGAAPMIWKELFASPGLRLHWLGRVVLGLLCGASFIWPFMTFYFYAAGALRWPGYVPVSLDQVAESMHWWVRVVGTGVGCLMLVGVATHAAGAISTERDKHTFDDLLTTPLTAREMLFAKWLGSVLCLRWGWAWLGAILLLGALSGGIEPVAVPLIVVAWFVYAGFLALLGLWFSATCRTSLWATLWTLLGAFGLTVGHYALDLCVVVGLSVYTAGRVLSQSESHLVYLGFYFQLFGLTPPLALGLFAFRAEEFAPSGYYGASSFPEMMACGLLGLGLWALAALGLWAATYSRFRVEANRVPLARPGKASRVSRPRAAGRPPAAPRAPAIAEERVTPARPPDGADTAVPADE